MLTLAHAAFETAKISLPTVLEARRGELKQEDCDRRLRSWSEALLKRVDAQLTVKGLENLLPNSSFVVVSNHQSHYDIPALYQALPLSLRMAAKKELFSTPLWGSALRSSGFVEIDRKSPKAAFRSLRASGKALVEREQSLFVAPEGTRSQGGQLGEFKRGAFEIARTMRLPILPVAISGTWKIHAKGALMVTRSRPVTVTVLPIIEHSQFKTTEELRVAAQEQIRACLERD